MPLVLAVEHQLALLEDAVRAAGDGVHAALVDIRQLHGAVLLTLEEKAGLLLLVKQGVDILHAQVIRDFEALQRIELADGRKLTVTAGADPDGALGLVGNQGKINAGFQQDRFIQVKERKLLAVVGDGEDGHPRFEVQIQRAALQAAQLALLVGNGPEGLLPGVPLGKAAVGQPILQDFSVTGKGQLIQVPNHWLPLRVSFRTISYHKFCLFQLFFWQGA